MVMFVYVSKYISECHVDYHLAFSMFQNMFPNAKHLLMVAVYVSEYVSNCDAFFDGRCYKAYDERKTFHEARDTCIADGGSLVVVCDAETNGILTDISHSRGQCYLLVIIDISLF